MQPAEFVTFSTPHLSALALTLAVPLLLAGVARASSSGLTAARIGFLLAGVLLVNEIVHWGYRIVQLGFPGFVSAHLPLHACGVSVFATSFALVTRHQRVYEIAFFWGLAAASNAVLTPSTQELAFPGYRFFQYFVAHSGIVAGVLYATWALGMRPTMGGLFRAFALLNLYAAAIALVNVALGTNYLYLSEPPTGTITPFFFLPWPWYIVALEVLALAMFLLLLSPFLLASRVNRSQLHSGESMW